MRWRWNFLMKNSSVSNKIGWKREKVFIQLSTRPLRQRSVCSLRPLFCTGSPVPLLSREGLQKKRVNFNRVGENFSNDGNHQLTSSKKRWLEYKNSALWRHCAGDDLKRNKGDEEEKFTVAEITNLSTSDQFFFIYEQQNKHSSHGH